MSSHVKLVDYDVLFSKICVTQINGCRHFTLPNEDLEYTPPNGSELFVARIPPDFSHKLLIQIFLFAGRLYDVRLMITFLRENKGFAFVRYFSPEEAASAVKILNGFQVVKGRRLAAMFSTDHRTLRLKGCFPGVTRDEVENVSKAEIA